MRDPYWLNDEQMERLRPFFPKSHGRPRVDDRRVLSGIICFNRNGVRWRDAPVEHGPHKTLLQPLGALEPNGCLCPDHDRPGRRSSRSPDHDDRRDIFEGTPHGIEPERETGGRGRLIGRTKGGMNAKLHAVTDHTGRPIRFFVTAGQVSDDTDAATMSGSLPDADWLLADRGRDADWFRTHWQIGEFARASRPGRPARQRSNTTSGDTSTAIASSACSIASRTGDEWHHAITDAQRSSSRPSLSRQQSFSGYEA